MSSGPSCGWAGRNELLLPEWWWGDRSEVMLVVNLLRATHDLHFFDRGKRYGGGFSITWYRVAM